jgi:hypothetical protein
MMKAAPERAKAAKNHEDYKLRPRRGTEGVGYVKHLNH